MNAQDIRSREDLLKFVGDGNRADYLFFWGHTPKSPDAIDQSCLSNWFPAPFAVDGCEYRTAEHFMMAAKARLFGDDDIARQIVACETPGDAKTLGRKVAGFDEDVWTQHRFDIVVTAGEAKFSQNAAMGEFLRGTSPKILVEASPRDRIWGIGMGKENEAAENPARWRGLNLLGFALMEVRTRLSAR